MKRPMLVCGIGALAAGALFMMFPAMVPYAIPLIASVFVIYLIKPFKLRKYIIIPAVLITATLLSVSLMVFNKTEISPYLKYDNTESYVYGKVTSVPKSIDNGDGYEFTLDAEKINSDAVDTKINIALWGEKAENIEIYDCISLEDCYLYIPQKEDISYDLSAVSDGVLLEATASDYRFIEKAPPTPYYYCLLVKQEINNVIDSFLFSDDAGLLKGMLFGDTDDMDYSVKQAYRNSGIAHLLAVSGLHTTLWCGLIISILSLFKIPVKIRNSFCLIFLLFFTIITGFSPSVVRSAIMTGVVLIAPLFKRMPDSVNSLGLSVVLILLNNPYTILSVSFQLSAMATLGVLISLPTVEKLSRKCNKLNQRHLIKIGKSIVSTAVISLFSGLFTLPVSSYYFGVFSILSPITNILTLTLSFLIMITGSIASVLGLINIPLIKEFTILSFKITKFLMDLLTEIAESISDISFCTIPVHKNFLIIAIVISAIIMATGYFIYKIKNFKKIKVITAIVTVVSVFITIFVPIISPKHKNTLSIIKTDSGTQIVVRSGLRYAYILNTSEYEVPSAADLLPKATSESLDYFIATFLTYKSILSLENVGQRYHPEETHITSVIQSIANNGEISIPQNTIIENEGYFKLNNEINFVIVDTYGTNYVIIESESRKAVVELYGSKDIADLKDSKDADILVYTNKIPESIPKDKTIVINGSAELYEDGSLRDSLRENSNIYYTQTDGNINIDL